MTQRMERALYVLGAAALSVLFHVAFVRTLSTRWEYFGFRYNNHGATAAATAYVLAVLPALWMPLHSRRSSITITWSLYVIVFIPSVFCVALISPRISDALPLLLSISGGMSFLTIIYYIRLPVFTARLSGARPANYRLFIHGATITAAAMLIATMVFYRESLQMPSLETMYDLRLASRAIQQESPIGKYFTHWLSRFLLPLLLLIALWRRRYIGVAAVVFAYTLLFMTTAHKVYFVVPVTVTAVHVLSRAFPKQLGISFLWSFVAMVALALAFESRLVGDLVLMRSMGWSGLATYIYDDFVQSHPVTWWSHVKGFSLFLSNPYSEPIPFVIGYEYWRNPDLTSNAHFWTLDGIMAAGHFGIFAISAACAALFLVLDSLAETVLPTISIPWMSAYATALCDAGLFSALLTGGLGFVLVLMLIIPNRLQSVPRGATRSVSRIRSHRGLLGVRRQDASAAENSL